MKESTDIERRYNSGESIPSHEFANPDGFELYGEVVHFLWRADLSTQQPTMFGEVLLQRVHPLKENTPEQEHLGRVEVPKGVTSPVRALVVDRFDNALDQMRITEVRTQLALLE